MLACKAPDVHVIVGSAAERPLIQKTLARANAGPLRFGRDHGRFRGPCLMKLENDLFEFEALEAAENYRRCILRLFRPFLGPVTLEVGSGVGQFSRMIRDLPEVETLHCVEPDPEFREPLKKLGAGAVHHESTIMDLDPAVEPEAIVSINVLEHIEDDEGELREYARRLRPKAGHFCVFTPAGQEIFAPIDKRFGHYRRYGKRELRRKLEAAGFEIVELRYFNFPGYFLWWIEFCIIRQARFNVRKVAIFDRYLFPIIHAIERIISPPLGQSVLAIARVRSGD